MYLKSLLLIVLFSMPSLSSTEPERQSELLLDFAEAGNLGEFRKLAPKADILDLAEALRLAGAHGYKSLAKYLLENHKFSQFTLDHALKAATTNSRESLEKLLKSYGAKTEKVKPKPYQPKYNYNQPSSTVAEWAGVVATVASVAGVALYSVWKMHVMNRHIADCVVCTESMSLHNSFLCANGHRLHRPCMLNVLVQTFHNHELESLVEAVREIVNNNPHEASVAARAFIANPPRQLEWERAKAVLADPRAQALIERMYERAKSSAEFFQQLSAWLAMTVMRNLPPQVMQMFNPAVMYARAHQRLTCPECRVQLFNLH